MLDKYYINQISGTLEGFNWKGNTANFRCPICGDSKTKKSKKRGNFYSKDGINYSFKCFNCHARVGSLSNYLKEYHPEDFKQYILDKFQDVNKRSTTPPIKKVKKSTKTRVGNSNNIHLPKLKGEFLDYVVSRKIPKVYQPLFSYTNNFREFAIDFLKGSENEKDVDIDNIPNDMRLIIPFYDGSGKVDIIQARAMRDNTIRYITLRRDSRAVKTYGIDRVNNNGKTPVYVTEGPIDSLFVPNCLASADSNLLKVDGGVYIYDNQYRNPQIVKLIKDTIDVGKRVVLFPSNVIGKDINEMILNGLNIRSLYNIIKENTYEGLLAELKLQELKRI